MQVNLQVFQWRLLSFCISKYGRKNYYKSLTVLLYYLIYFSILNTNTSGPAILSMTTFGKEGHNLDMVDGNRNKSGHPTGREKDK